MRFILLLAFTAFTNLWAEITLLEKGPPSPEWAAKVGDKFISNVELNKGIEEDLYQLELRIYEIRRERLNELIIDHLISTDKTNAALTREQYLEKVVWKGIEVPESEVKEFAKDKKINGTLDADTKNRIREFLLTQKKNKIKNEWFDKVAAKIQIEAYFSPPKIPRREMSFSEGPTIGPQDAPITIYEFTDLECPYCATGSKLMAELIAKLGSKVKVIYKSFPLPFHSEAKIAANALLCVHSKEAELFAKMKDDLFTNQDVLSLEKIEQLAKQLPVKDMDFYKKCLKSKTFFPVIDKDIEEGQRVGINSTPTYVVQGMIIRGVRSLEFWQQLIEMESKSILPQ